MTRLALVLFAAAAAAGPKPPKVKSADLPQAAKVEKMVALTPFSRVVFELDADGRLFWEGRASTLNEFDKTVLRHTEQRGIHLRRKPGKKGTEKLNDELEGSPVHVILRVHRQAPWRHVQWLMMVLQEQRAHKAEFYARTKNGREGVVKAWLTLGTAVSDEMEISADDEDETKKPPPAQAGTVAVTLLEAGAASRRFAGRTVPAPAGVTWAVGRERVQEFNDLAGTVAAAFSVAKRKSKTPRIEIRAGPRIPHGEVVRVLDLLRKYEHIDFGGAEVPSRRVRMAPTLPYPE